MPSAGNRGIEGRIILGLDDALIFRGGANQEAGELEIGAAAKALRLFPTARS